MSTLLTIAKESADNGGKERKYPLVLDGISETSLAKMFWSDSLAITDDTGWRVMFSGHYVRIVSGYRMTALGGEIEGTDFVVVFYATRGTIPPELTNEKDCTA